MTVSVVNTCICRLNDSDQCADLAGKICVAQKGIVLEPFWSEIQGTFARFANWSAILIVFLFQNGET